MNDAEQVDFVGVGILVSTRRDLRETFGGLLPGGWKCEGKPIPPEIFQIRRNDRCLFVPIHHQRPTDLSSPAWSRMRDRTESGSAAGTTVVTLRSSLLRQNEAVTLSPFHSRGSGSTARTRAVRARPAKDLDSSSCAEAQIGRDHPGAWADRQFWDGRACAQRASC